MPQDSDLTTAERVRAVSRVRPQGEADDLRLDILVSAASVAVRDYTERDFLFLTAPEGFDPDATSSKTFLYDGSGFVSFGPEDARAIESVTLDGEALEADEWKLGTVSKVGTYSSLRALPTLPACSIPGRDYADRHVVDLVVVAKWGVVDLPAVVELATIDTVKAWWGNPEGVRTRSFEGVTVDEDGGDPGERGALPQRARLLLEPYRRG